MNGNGIFCKYTSVYASVYRKSKEGVVRDCTIAHGEGSGLVGLAVELLFAAVHAS